MIHDQGLVDQLSALAVERFEGVVFRATGASANPLAFSVNGGRWAPASRDGADVPSSLIARVGGETGPLCAIATTERQLLMRHRFLLVETDCDSRGKAMFRLSELRLAFEKLVHVFVVAPGQPVVARADYGIDVLAPVGRGLALTSEMLHPGEAARDRIR